VLLKVGILYRTKTQKMKNKTTLYHFIVDRSGSMYDCIDDTIGGFNAQLTSIEELKSECPDQKFLTSVTLFNT
jgi:hypothetical protein